jgi:hypothetical protein
MLNLRNSKYRISWGLVMSSSLFGWRGWLLVMGLLVVMSQRYVFSSFALPFFIISLLPGPPFFLVKGMADLRCVDSWEG